MALLLAAIAAVCPLQNAGVMAYHTVNPTAPWGYRIYIGNPSDQDEFVAQIEIVLREPSREAYYDDDIQIDNIEVPKRSQISINLGERPDIDPTLLIGAHIDCSQP